MQKAPQALFFTYHSSQPNISSPQYRLSLHWESAVTYLRSEKMLLMFRWGPQCVCNTRLSPQFAHGHVTPQRQSKIFPRNSKSAPKTQSLYKLIKTKLGCLKLLPWLAFNSRHWLQFSDFHTLVLVNVQTGSLQTDTLCI